MTEWQRIDTEIIFSHPRMVLAEDTVLLPDGKETLYLRFDGYPDYPTVIAIDDEDKILMIREQAYPINRVLLQFPEGDSTEGESAIEAAERELAEETGLKAKELQKIGENLHHHRRSTAKNHVIVAKGISAHEARPAGDAEEAGIELVWLTEDEIWQEIANGGIIQKNALAAWATFQASRRTKQL